MVVYEENDFDGLTDFSWRTSTPLDDDIFLDLFAEDTSFQAAKPTEPDDPVEELTEMTTKLDIRNGLIWRPPTLDGIKLHHVKYTDKYIDIKSTVRFICLACRCIMPLIRDLLYHRVKIVLHVKGKKHVGNSKARMHWFANPRALIPSNVTKLSKCSLESIFRQCHITKKAKFFTGFVTLKTSCTICECRLQRSDREDVVTKMVAEHVAGKKHQRNLNRVKNGTLVLPAETP